MLIEVIERKLERDLNGNTIIDFFSKIEKIAIEELHKSVQLHWFAKWKDYYLLGNWLNSPDSLDFVEMFLRIEEEFGINFKALEATSESDFGDTAGKTVQFIWSVNLRVNTNFGAT